VSGDVNQYMNPLENHDVHAKGNMDNIPKIITIDISKILGIMENVFISA
jgi:hypothetical protein